MNEIIPKGNFLGFIELISKYNNVLNEYVRNVCLSDALENVKRLQSH